MSERTKKRGVGLPLLLFFCFAVLLVLALFSSEPKTLTARADRAFRGIDTNEERLALLNSFGWEAEENPAEVAEVCVPREFDEVYEAYNDLQKPLGLDLFSLRGRTLRRYTYVVTNHTDQGTVYANLLFSLDTFVGGDLCSAAPDGFVTCLLKNA